MSRCPNCKTQIVEPLGEEGEHECPKCHVVPGDLFWCESCGRYAPNESRVEVEDGTLMCEGCAEQAGFARCDGCGLWLEKTALSDRPTGRYCAKCDALME